MGWRDPQKRGSTCSVYILDVEELAPSAGVPICSLSNFSATRHSAMLLMEPRTLGITIPKPKNAEEAKSWPWVSKPHYVAQSGAPWYLLVVEP